MPHDVLAKLALLSPLLAAVILLLAAPLRKNGRLSAALCIAATSVSLIASVLLALDFPAAAEPLVMKWSWLPSGRVALATVGIRVDAIAASMSVVVALVALCVQIYSTGYLGHEPSSDRGRYFTYQALFAFSMLGLVLAPNLLQLFLCWELVGLVSYLLIGYYWTKPSAARAALKAFWVTKFADVGLMLGLMILYETTGSFDWQVTLTTPEANLIAGLFLLAVAGKSAQFPLHIWLPDAMEGPTPVSALLHAATMVAAGVYLIVRSYPIFAAAADVLVFMAWLGGFTALFAATLACFQDDIKKVLAYSTCSQLGYMVAALGTGSMLGGYFHLTTHAAFKALLFLGAGSLIHAVHSNNLSDMGGLWRKMKPSAVMFIIGAAALAGLPPFSGFFSKDMLLEELLHAGHLGPLAAGILGAGMTAFYMTRVVLLAFFGEPSEAAQKAHESPVSMLGPMAALAIPAAIAGLMLPLFAAMAGNEEAAFHITPVGMTATAAGLIGIGLGFAFYRPSKRGAEPMGAVVKLRALVMSGAVDRSAEVFYRRGLGQFAAAIGWLDRYVVDGLVNLSGWVVLEGMRYGRRLQTGRAGDYIYAVVVGLIVLTAAGVFAP